MKKNHINHNVHNETNFSFSNSAEQDKFRFIMRQLDRTKLSGNSRNRVGLYRQALELLKQSQAPLLWAKLQVELAVLLARSSFDDSPENFEEAIFHFEEALKVHTRQAYPIDWAMSQSDMGGTYLNRIRGERVENVQQAIIHFQLALKVFSRRTSPELWAKVHNHLGSAHRELIDKNRKKNLEEAMRHYEKALQVFTFQEFPIEWAKTQHNLASSYQLSNQGKQEENLERAIVYYGQALKIFNPETDVEQWAQTYSMLASAYHIRVRGERAENLEQSIAHFKEILRLVNQDQFPDLWANTKNNLGAVFTERIEGNRADNLEQAIKYYEESLQVHTRQDFPGNWARTTSNLALTYQDRIRGERAENLERSILYNKDALDAITRNSHPEIWAEIQHNLGNAYLHRIRGENGNQDNNLKEAIIHFKLALEVLTRDLFPEQWAAIQHDLALAHKDYKGNNQAENQEIAIVLLEQVLNVYTQQAFTQRWAMTQGSLGLAYSERMVEDHAENLEKAIACFERSLQVLTSQSFPRYCADMLNNIARTYRMRIHGERIENQEMALVYYEQALQIITPQTNPIKCRTTGRRAGQLAMELGNWKIAEKILLDAIEADQLLNQIALSRDARDSELSLAKNLYTNAAFCLVHNNKLEKAIEILEGSRARQMREALERNRRDLTILTKLGYQELYTKFLDADRGYQELMIQEWNDDHPDGWQIKSEVIQNVRNAAIQSIREQVGKENPEFRYFLGYLPFNEIQRQAQSSPLVYLFASESGGMALLVCAKHIEVIDLPVLTVSALEQLVISNENENSYLAAYGNRKVDKHAWLDWLRVLQNSSFWMWNAFMGSIIQELGHHNVSKAVFVPFGLLGVLPLHAAAPSQGGICASDIVEITYTPSVHALLNIRLNPPGITAQSVLAIENPNPDGILQLSNSADEIDAIMDGFDICLQLKGNEATREKIISEISNYDVLHFSTHGVADFDEPIRSGILAADEKMVTLEDFFDIRLENAHLVILSACETSIPADLEKLDEVISLPAGIVQAGASAVIGTLWSVADMTTAILMARFYKLWRKDGISPSKALQLAQHWLKTSTLKELQEYFKKDLPEFAEHTSSNSSEAFFKYLRLSGNEDEIPFEHPYYWAGFTYTGA